MAVQQHVLNWLYSVLTSEYRDVNRAYSDVAQALAQYPSLSPRTDVHTSSNGSSALLVRLTGTIPVPFRGTTYRFPISLWVPHGYPQEAPLVYVTPTEHMMVRPGQHVDPQGQVYHPYLAGWAGFWDKSSILDFLAILRDVFAKEPPVVARQPGGPPPPPLTQQLQTSLPPPVPPLPPDLAPRSPSQVQHYSPEAAARPPPPPPKPGMQADLRQPHVQRSPRSTGPPPVPPLPPKAGRPMSQYTPEDPRLHHEQHGRPGPSRYETAPPLPPQAPQSPPAPPRPFHPPVQQQQSPPAGAQYQRPPPPPSNFSPGPPQPSYLPATGPRRSLSPRRQDFTPLPPQSWQQQQLPIQQAPSQPKSPVPDIMDADDLTLSIPTSTTTTAAAPPIPPNPEKDALLHQLASTLFTLRQQARDQNASSLVGLQAQRQAMLLASNRLQAESAQLTQLSNLLTSNTAILQDSLRKADTVIESSSRLPEPNIDELLVAPTVVGNQLYDLVAEERALADAIFVLGRAVERGRIAPQTFARLTRSLAREWYLKKALVRKIGVGMGLSKGVGH
ncbi:UEV domain-containing protein [Triangularia setosa]|uniref:UEV domain-containing protein n=1 Tax=Triangularia setosa TaxID=2587417 RepID=A0AAN6W1Z5_9PEZI|nr:UEV domain-containing protein [Podospora setosa]